MKILVTGATGFIGSHLIKALARQTSHTPIILRRKTSTFQFSSDVERKCVQFELEEGAANIGRIIREARPDLVIHLAALTRGKDPSSQTEELIQANVVMPAKLLEAMAACGVERFINTGTSWEHFNESQAYDPVDLYAATKKAFEDILYYYAKAHHLNALTIKLYDTYGPDDPRPKIFSFLRNAQEQKATDLSPGEQSMDLLYIDDVVGAYRKAVDYLTARTHRELESIFIGSGQSYPLKEIVSLYEKVSGTRLNVRWGGRPYRAREVMRAKADIRAAREKLGWQPEVSLEEGLTRMLAPVKAG